MLERLPLSILCRVDLRYSIGRYSMSESETQAGCALTEVCAPRLSRGPLVFFCSLRVRHVAFLHGRPVLASTLPALEVSPRFYHARRSTEPMP